MEIVHNQGRFSIKKDADAPEAGFIMSNRYGNFLWFGQEPASRYQGWFFECEGQPIKVVEDIRAVGAGPVTKIVNNFWNFQRVHREVVEEFFLPQKGNCMVYETQRSGDIEIVLDIKEIYSSPEMGRHYQVWQENGLLMVSYRQDQQFAAGEVFVAVAGDILNVRIRNEWIKREYKFDRDRGSVPWERWVFVPASVRASEIVIGAANTKEEAQARARKIWNNLAQVKKDRQKASEFFDRRFVTQNFGETTQQFIARQCAANSLRALLMWQNGSIGLRAGLPWFFQFWQRDEAVSLKGLNLFDPDNALTAFYWQLKELRSKRYHFDTADGTGWFYKRAQDFIDENKLSSHSILKISACLERSIEQQFGGGTKNGLAANGFGRTWMDSLNRPGNRIEIQAFYLNMYALAARLAQGPKLVAHYKKMEQDMKSKVRRFFFDGKQLADGFDPDTNKVDLTARPNIFLAAYIYPDLLSKEEWIACFGAALSKLWLDWGGLATIDKNAVDFHGQDTGENPAGYHNGDSWFYVNNIAAIVMKRTDKNRYKKYIDRIFDASTQDILWNGAIGSASEISSAQFYKPCGCLNQTWSNATYLELCDELGN